MSTPAQRRPEGWSLAWIVWLTAFLVVEIPAALKRTGTLSQHVWMWFRGPLRRSVLASFMVSLTAHFVFQASAWWLLTAVPVAAVIVDSVWFGEMSLIDRAARALALRWLKGKVDGARKGGSAAMKLIDGNKRLIVVLAFIVSGFVALLTGNDVSQWIDLILRAMGWTDAALINDAKGLATQIVPMLFAIWAAVSALIKMWQQRKAGATLAEINSPTGVVKAAIADGTLRSNVPVVLSIADKPKPDLAAPPVEMLVMPASKVEVGKLQGKE